MNAPAGVADRTARLRVQRRKAGDPEPHFEDFDVPIGPSTTVLDALVAIRRDQDPSLTLRHSCFHASCGTCGMRIDGQEGLACVTAIGGRTEVTVEPLGNLPVVSDLVVDMDGFYSRLDPIDRPLIQASDTAPEVLPEGVDGYTRFEDCIECGICLAACPIAGSDPRYVGPAALAAAWRVVDEPRGAATGPIIALMDDEQAAWRCHVAWECSEACPSNVDPAGAIMQLRRAAVGARARRLLGIGGRS